MAKQEPREEMNDIDMAEPLTEAQQPENPHYGKVAVVTGASSGIGRATALEFARNGYFVVLAARRKRELEEVAAECREHGVEALVQQTDTTDEMAVQQLAAAAIQHFGAINVWVNDAAVSVYGSFVEVPTEDFRQVMETNVMGYVHGARAALSQFRKQGYGRLINISSINAMAPVPYSSAYVTSKYAVRGLTESIRMELEAEGLLDTIQVSNVMPASIDTNLFQNAANYSHQEVQALEPVYDPALVAREIVKLAKAEHPKRELIIGSAGKVMMLEHAHMHRMYEKMFSRFTRDNNFGRQPAGNATGSLYSPVEDNTGIRGGWKQRRITGTTVNVAAGAAVAALAGLAGFAMLASRRHHHHQAHHSR